MSQTENLVLHHGGKWSDENYNRCIGGEIAYKEVDIDYISMFELFGYFSDLGYTTRCRIWYKIAGLSPPEGVEEIVDDRICQEMFDFNKNEDYIDIYYVSSGPLLQTVGRDD